MIVTEEQKKESHAFYKEAVDLLAESNASYLLGGVFAVFHYTEVFRDTKDLDVFCKYSEHKGFRCQCRFLKPFTMHLNFWPTLFSYLILSIHIQFFSKKLLNTYCNIPPCR